MAGELLAVSYLAWATSAPDLVGGHMKRPATVPRESGKIRREGPAAAEDRDRERRRALAETAGALPPNPYPPADVLAEYAAKGLPHLADRIVEAIDQEFAHRRQLERASADGDERRKGFAQWGAIALGMLGTLGALGAAYMGVPASVCVVVVVVSVGGPNAATIVGRLLDRIDRAARG